MVGLGTAAAFGKNTIEAKAAAAASGSQASMDGLVTLTLNPLKTTDNFEVGGRSGNVVTFSNASKIGKGWRLLQIDSVDVGSTGAEVAAALGAARKRKGSFTATFYGGKIAGGGGMNMEALAKAAASVKTLKKLTEKAKPPAAAPPPAAAQPPPPPPQPPLPLPPAGGGQGDSLFGGLCASLQQSGSEPPASPSKAEDEPGVPTKAEMRVEFISFDYDRDGKLSSADFGKMLQASAAAHLECSSLN